MKYGSENDENSIIFDRKLMSFMSYPLEKGSNFVKNDVICVISFVKITLVVKYSYQNGQNLIIFNEKVL